MTSLQLLLVTCSPSRGKSSQRYTVFSAKEVTPLSADKFERRLEKYVRELARVILQRTIRKIESDVTDQTVASFEFAGQRYRRNRRTANAMTTEIADKFQSLVGQKFEIVQDGRASFSATLDEVCRYCVTNDVHRPSHLPRRQGYSLVFVPDSGETIDPSGLCRLMHPALESDHVLVVPVEGNAKLEAVFN